MQESLTLSRAMPYPLAEARTLHELGTTHILEGDLTQAGDRFTEAIGIFRRLGAAPFMTKSELALVSIGRR